MQYLKSTNMQVHKNSKSTQRTTFSTESSDTPEYNQPTLVADAEIEFHSFAFYTENTD